MTAELDQAVAKRLSDVVANLALADPVSPQEEACGGSMRRRRGFSRQEYSELATLSLLREEAAYRWIHQTPVRGNSFRRARRFADRRIGSEVVHEFSFQQIPPSGIGAELQVLDKKLTRHEGLRKFNAVKGELDAAKDLSIRGRILLLLHGTFSKGEMFVDELNATDAGKKFLARAAAGPRYKAIVTFDHPTLSVSPWINALDLERELANVEGPIDVVCHGRGGLVVGWWLRNAKRKVENVVFVGTPLQGTSLAHPANLRSALQGLANVVKGLEAERAPSSTIDQFAAAVIGLSKIYGGVLQLGTSTAPGDAAVAVVPGLAAQARGENNAELSRLNGTQWISQPAIHAVMSNFQPEEDDEIWWPVWKLMRSPRDRFLDWGADVLFDDKTDLLVDTESMKLLCGQAIDRRRVCYFDSSTTVHHCNYFRQPETVKLLTTALQL